MGLRPHYKINHTMKIIKLIVGVLVGSIFVGFGSYAYAALSAKVPVKSPGYVEPFTFFSATTTTATSTTSSTQPGGFVVAGAKKVVLQFSRGGVTNPNTGLTTFRVQGTTDGGDTWFYLERLLGSDVSETASSTPVINAATSSSMYAIDLDNFGVYAIRCIAVETTDGEHTCKAFAEY